MTDGFTLWAQALDNSSPDHFEVGGEELASDDAVRRQNAVACVSHVIKNGTRFFEANGVILTVDASHFVLEVPSAQRDRAGRAAPIVCYGQYDAGETDALGVSAAGALDDFAKRIGRTLRPDHFELLRAPFAVLKKKSRTMKLRRTLGIGALSLALLGIAYWLVQGNW